MQRQNAIPVRRRCQAPRCDGFRRQWAERERELSERIARARDMVNTVRYSRRDQISFAYLTWKMGLPYDLITALDWKETVAFDHVDRRNRVPDFPRKNLTYQKLRKYYHLLRRR